MNEEYGVNSPPIEEGFCTKDTGSAKLDTSFSKYYLEASVSGKLTIPGKDSSACYAYSFNPLDFKYDYGDGECKFTVSTDVRVAVFMNVSSPIYAQSLLPLLSQCNILQCHSLTSRPRNHYLFVFTD